MPDRPGSVGTAIAWMFLLSVLLFWLPFLGALIAGFVGGRKAGGLGNAILAVFLPAIVFGILLAVFATAFTGFPLFAFVTGLGGIAIAILVPLIHVGPLLLGALLGALI